MRNIGGSTAFLQRLSDSSSNSTLMLLSFMGSNLLFFWNLSGSEKYTLIIYYRSLYCSKCPLSRWQLDTYRELPTSSQVRSWLCSVNHGLHLLIRWCSYRPQDGPLQVVMWIQGCHINVLCLLMYYRECSTSRLNLHSDPVPKAMQLLKSLWVRSNACKRPLQAKVRASSGGDQEDHGSKLDK